MQLSQAIDGYFIVRRFRLAATTQENYRFAFNKLRDYFGADKEFIDITANDIRAYLTHLEAHGLSERSLHDTRIILSSLWTFAAEEFGAPQIIKSVEAPTYIATEIVPFTQQEVQAILAAAEWTQVWNTSKGRHVRAKRPTWRRDVALITVLVDSGLRVSEAANLRIADYRQENGQLFVRRGKGKKQRSLYLGATAQRVLWRYLMSRDKVKPDDPIFCTREIKPLSRSYIGKLIGRCAANAGVQGAHPHRFRHTFAIQFLRNGGNVFELQRILGHAELDTVKIYLSIAQVDIERSQKANSPADNWRL